jgi:hypothetical protein
MRLVDPKRRWHAAAWGVVLFSAGYLTTGRLHAGAPATLELLPPDRILPFVPWTVWIYLSEALFLAWVVATLREAKALTRVFLAMTLASGVAFLVFFFFPTEISRAAVTGVGRTARAFRFLYALDTPANCFPSLYVALAVIAAEGAATQGRLRAKIATVWSGLLVLSALTTKQHYFADVAAGLVLAVIAIGIAAVAVREPRGRVGALGQPLSA